MANTKRLLSGIAAVISCKKTIKIVGRAMLNLSPKEIIEIRLSTSMNQIGFFLGEKLFLPHARIRNFVEKSKETNSDTIRLFALMTTTLQVRKKLLA
jgi:methanogenic corrinoid protein MtbC1